MIRIRNARAERSAPRDAKQIIVLCGPSHSGKSTFARRFAGRFRIISSDEIRRDLTLTKKPEPSQNEDSVWAEFSARKRAAMRAGEHIVLDVCNLSPKARRHALEDVDAGYRKVCVVFDRPFRMLRERCLREKRISLAVVREIWQQFRKPTKQELLKQGFDEVYFVSK
jgi:predicted kinase